MREPSASSTRSRRQLDDVGVRPERAAERARERADVRRGSTWASSASTMPPAQSDARPGSSARQAAPSSHSPSRATGESSKPRRASRSVCSRRRRAPPRRPARARPSAGRVPEARRLVLEREDARGGARGAAPGPAALEHADVEAALRRASNAHARPMIPPPTIAASYRSTMRTIGSAAVDGIDRRARLARSRLYLVLEARPHGEDPSRLLDAALRGGVDIVQLRDKDAPDEELVRAAEPFRRACDAHGALFVLNDRPDLVERTGADGVHVGSRRRAARRGSEARRRRAPRRALGDARRAELERRPGLLRRRRDLRDADEARVGGRRPRARARRARHAARAVVRDRRHRRRRRSTRSSHTARPASRSSARSATRRIRRRPLARCARRSRRATPSSTQRRRRAAAADRLARRHPNVRAEARRAAHARRAHRRLLRPRRATLELRLGDGTARVPAGSCVAALPLLVHGFRNPEAEEARFLNLHAPGVWARGQEHGLDAPMSDQFRPEPGDRPAAADPQRSRRRRPPRASRTGSRS